jgi:hypothetical protein
LSEQLQLRSGTAAQVAAFTGASAECVVDTTNNRIVVSDGSTVGGFPASKLSETLTNTYAAVSDTAYAVPTPSPYSFPWVSTVGYTTLTATRVVSLPAASAYPAGAPLRIVDETGNCSSSVNITVTPNGTDDINGVNASVALSSAYAHIALLSDGVSKWTVVDQGYLTASKLLAESAHGALASINIIEFQQSGLSGASVTCSTQIPANCIVLAVGLRVTTTVTGPTSFEVGVSGTLTQFGTISSGSFTPGSTNYGLIGPTAFYSATNLILTSAGGSFTAGAVRLAIHYLSVNPPAQ